MNIQINNNYKTITAADGMVLTNWDKSNILDFSFCKEMCAPLSFNESAFYEITDTECAVLCEELENNIKREILN